MFVDRNETVTITIAMTNKDAELLMSVLDDAEDMDDGYLTEPQTDLIHRMCERLDSIGVLYNDYTFSS